MSHRVWLFALCVACMLPVCGGCGQGGPLSPPEGVKALASTWPEYQAPITEGTLQLYGHRPRLQSTPAAAATVPPRIRPFRDWDLKETMLDSLGRIGGPAVPALVKSLRHPDPNVRERAAQLLSRIGPDAHHAVPALIVAVQDEHADVQKAAVRALGQIGPAAAEAVEPFMQAIYEPQPPAAQPPVQRATYTE